MAYPHKWSPISYKSSAGQRKHIGQRPMLYHTPYGGRPRLRRLCVRWGSSYFQKKGHTQPHPTFGPCVLWPNGWMDEHAHVYCGQMAGWMNTPLGTEVDLGTGHIVLDVVPAVREMGTAVLWPRSPISATAELLLSLSRERSP